MGEPDAGMPDAGTATPGFDAGAPDAGSVVDAGSTDSLCPAQAVFCESFETGTLDPLVWRVDGSASAVSIDATQGYEGTHSLHVRKGSAYGITGSQVAQMIKGIPTPDDRLYMRAFVRFGNLRLPMYHPNFISVVGPDYVISEWEKHNRWSFGSFLGELSVNALGTGLDGAKLWTEPANVYTDPDGDSTPDTEHDLMAGQWFCVETMGFGDDQGPGDTSHPNEELRVWINDTEIPELYGNDERWAPWGASEHWSPIYNGSLWGFGIDGAYADGPTLDIWFDSIAFSNQRLGCGGSL